MNFFNYLLKAKGRHGTHSPYIYKFVEDALHENKAFTPDYPGNVKGKQARTLFRVLSYIRETQQVIASAAVLQGNAWLQYFKPLIADPRQVSATQPSVLVLSLEEMAGCREAFFTKEVSSGSICLVLHAGNPDYTLLESYFNCEGFNATLFTWNFSILMNRPDFKRKQHFILR